MGGRGVDGLRTRVCVNDLVEAFKRGVLNIVGVDTYGMENDCFTYAYSYISG